MRLPATVQAVLLLAVLALALYLRSVAVIDTRVDHPLRADAGDYVFYALNMTEQGTYSRSRSAYHKDPQPPKPDAVRSPGYPAMIAAILLLTPDRIERTVILWVQVVLSTLTVLMAWYLFRQVLPFAASIATALFTALSPHLVMMNVYYLTETLYAFLLIGSIVLLWTFASRPTPAVSLASGIALGISALVRPTIQYFVFVVGGLVAWSRRNKQGSLFASLIIIGFLLATVPWALRNLSTLGTWSDKTVMIGSIAHGMYPEFRYQDLDHTYAMPYRFDPKPPHRSKTVAAVLAELKSRVMSDPARYIKWYLQKPLWLWRWETVQGTGEIYIYPVFRSPYEGRTLFQITRSAMKVLHVPFLLLAFAGSLLPWLASARKYYDPGQLFLLRSVSSLLIYYTLVHVIVAPFPRYSIPLRPFVYGMAMVACHYSVVWLRSKYNKRSQGNIA